MQLLIMAAGMGSRFGGLKQVEPMGPNGEFIIDYSIYDALKTGFTKVVFIIKEENYKIFKETIGKRVESFIDVEYVFQKLDNVPSFVNIPKERVKPWGTAHAILSAKDAINEDFLVINADDFYGRDAFLTAKEFLESTNDNKYSSICYKAKNTMTENGSVKRGVVKEENGNIKEIIESKLENINGKILASPLDGSDSFNIDNDALVSMNMLTFDTSIFPFLEQRMNIFFRDNQNNLETCEFLIPTELNYFIENGKEIKVLKTNATWHGVTYKEDTPNVKEKIKELVVKGEYPNELFK